MNMPYRTPTFTSKTEESTPWWQCAWFRVDRDDAAQRWQWARRAIGGRWCRFGEERELAIERAIVAYAHGITEARHMGYDPDAPQGRAIVTAFVIRDYGFHEWRVVDRCPGLNRRGAMTWRIRGECYGGHCVCEVWP